MRQTEPLYHEAAIMTRLAGPDEPGFSAAVKAILTLGYSPADKDCMHTLAAKAREGKLTPDGHAEVEAYSRVGSPLGILKSKAHRALNHPTTTRKAKTLETCMDRTLRQRIWRGAGIDRRPLHQHEVIDRD